VVRHAGLHGTKSNALYLPEVERKSFAIAEYPVEA
jgi:hypothetical protein